MLLPLLQPTHSQQPLLLLPLLPVLPSPQQQPSLPAFWLIVFLRSIRACVTALSTVAGKCCMPLMLHRIVQVEPGIPSSAELSTGAAALLRLLRGLAACGAIIAAPAAACSGCSQV
jgi:hypothetical protein